MLGCVLIEVLLHGTVIMYHELQDAVQSYRADKALSMDKLWRCLAVYMDYCATQATASAACVEPAAVDQADDESADAAAESAEQDEPDAEQPAAEGDDAVAEEVALGEASAEADDAAISEGAESAEAEVGLTADAAAEEGASAGSDTQQVESAVTLPCYDTYDKQLHVPQLYHSL